MRFRFLLAISLCTAAAGAYAEIYKYVDENGKVTYSNLPLKGGKRLDLPELSTIPGQRGTQNATPGAFPKVDGKTQRERDDIRRKILEDELKSEERALADAQAALKDDVGLRAGEDRASPKYLDRVLGLKGSVEAHEKNGNPIRKELGNLR